MKTLYSSARILFSFFFFLFNLPSAQCSDPAALSYDSGAKFHDISQLNMWYINHYQTSVMVNQGGWNGQPADEELLAYFNLPSEPGNSDFVPDNSYTETFRLSNYDHDLIYTGYTNWDADYVYLQFDYAEYNKGNNSLIYRLDCDDPSTGIPSGNNYYEHSLSSNDSEAVNDVLCDYLHRCRKSIGYR